MEPFRQGYLDSLCGIYSILNADKVINNPTKEESELLFNNIIRFLSKKRILRDIIIEGSDHKTISKIMDNVVVDRIPLRMSNKKSLFSIDEWWKYSQEFLSEKLNRAVIVSIGGKDSHLTVANKITNKRMFLLDSNWREFIKKDDCTTVWNYDETRHVIYPAQCWYLGKE